MIFLVQPNHLDIPPAPICARSPIRSSVALISRFACSESATPAESDRALAHTHHHLRRLFGSAFPPSGREGMELRRALRPFGSLYSLPASVLAILHKQAVASAWVASFEARCAAASQAGQGALRRIEPPSRTHLWSATLGVGDG